MKVVAELVVSTLVAIATYVLLGYNTEGDQLYYRGYYNYINGLGLLRAIQDSYDFIGSMEPIYPLIVWGPAQFLNKDLFVAMANGFLAFASLRLFSIIAVSAWISYVSVLTNFYFMVLYSGAERLKFALLLFVLAVIFLVSRRFALGGIFLASSVLTHSQVFLFLLGEVFYRGVTSLLNGLTYKKLFAATIAIALGGVLFFLLREHVYLKLQYYVGNGVDWGGLLRLLVLYVASLFVGRDRLRISCWFMVFFAAAFLVGAERIVIFAFFAYLVSLSNVRSLTSAVVSLGLIAYFFHKSIFYILSVISYGHGF